MANSLFSHGQRLPRGNIWVDIKVDMESGGRSLGGSEAAQAMTKRGTNPLPQCAYLFVVFLASTSPHHSAALPTTPKLRR